MAAGDFDHFPQLIQALHEGAKVGVRVVAKVVRDEASQTCPYDTGFLAASHYYVASDVSTYNQAVNKADRQAERDVLSEVPLPERQTEAVVAVAAPYGIYVHEGTRHVSGRPWLAQAANGSRDRVLKATGDALTHAIKDALGG